VCAHDLRLSTVAVEISERVATCSINNGDINLFDTVLYTDMRFALTDGAMFNQPETPSAQAAMARFLTQGGQTVAGERRLGELVGELSRHPEGPATIKA
jgi:hypothetical protein